MKTFTSGELAKHVGVNGETIRYYERIGILTASDRRSSGYRIFTDCDVQRLRFIRSAKSLGFTLREIKVLLRLNDNSATQCRDMKELAVKKVADVNQKISELTEIRRQLQSLIDSDCPDSIHPAACHVRPTITHFNVY